LACSPSARRSGSTFCPAANFKIILTQTVIVAIAALGMTLIIVSGGIDLSVGSVVALTSVVGAVLMVHGYPPLAVLFLTVSAGALVGLANGAVIPACE
jgi:ribose transport system permease protein